MSEYIVDFGDDGKSAVRIAMAKQHGAVVRGELVRCRDCIYYTKDPEPIDPGWPMICERTGADMVEPYGFCAWPERKREAMTSYKRKTCHNDIDGDESDFVCSECRARLYIENNDGYTMILEDETLVTMPNFCPNCGAQVIK